MTGPNNDQRLPDGTCHGRDLPESSRNKQNGDQYGAGNGALDRGYTDSSRIGGTTKSDKGGVNG